MDTETDEPRLPLDLPPATPPRSDLAVRPMIGSFVVYEGTMRDRWVARQIVDATAQFWLTQNPDFPDNPARRVKKSSMGRIGIFPTHKAATAAAKALNEQLAALAKEYDARRATIFHAALGPKLGE